MRDNNIPQVDAHISGRWASVILWFHLGDLIVAQNGKGSNYVQRAVDSDDAVKV